MARDRALLDAAGRRHATPTLRLYGWDRPTVSLGRHQPDPEPAAIAALAALGAGWVRRPTGGRAVWHGPLGEELTYAVAAPIGVLPLAGGLAEVHREIHRAIATGLARLGVATRPAPGAAGRSPRPTDRRACFATAIGGELVVDGRKLVGSAQRRSRGALLQHGSIPLAGDPRILDRIWPGCMPPERATTVAEAAGAPVDRRRLAAALVTGFAATLNVRFAAGVLTTTETAAIDAPVEPAAIA